MPDAERLMPLPIAEPPRLEPDATELLRALAHPLRLQLLGIVASRGPVCRCHLEDELPHSQPPVSKHLNQMRRAGLVATRREGRSIYYSVVPDALERLGGTLLAMATATRTPHAADHCD